MIVARESSPIDKRTLAKMVMTLFDHWNLSAADRTALLGLSPRSRSSLSRFRHGAAIGVRRDQYDRVSLLLGIHTRLRVLFPRNRDLAYRWMTVHNRAFDGRTPVEVVREMGMCGLHWVRGYLERAGGDGTGPLHSYPHGLKSP